MRAYALILVGCAAVLLEATGAVQACGDKFLLVGRGVAFRRAYAAVYPASIVVYAQPQRSSAKERDESPGGPKKEEELITLATRAEEAL